MSITTVVIPPEHEKTALELCIKLVKCSKTFRCKKTAGSWEFEVLS